MSHHTHTQHFISHVTCLVTHLTEILTLLGIWVSFRMLLLFFKSEPCPQYLSIYSEYQFKSLLLFFFFFNQPLCVLVNSDTAVSVALVYSWWADVAT